MRKPGCSSGRPLLYAYSLETLSTEPHHVRGGDAASADFVDQSDFISLE